MMMMMILFINSSMMMSYAHSLKGGDDLSLNSGNSKTVTIGRSDVTIFASSVVRFFFRLSSIDR